MWNDNEVIQILLPSRRITLDELKRWRASFMNGQVLLEEQRMCGKDISRLNTHLLMCWDVCYVWLSSCTIGSETIFDEHLDQFADIIHRAQLLLGISATTSAAGLGQQEYSNYDMKVIPALYFTGIKCRDPVLRRKAIHLLRQAPSDGSLWAYVLLGRVIEHIAALEEGCRYRAADLTDPTVLAELCARPLPPEERRIQHIAITGQERKTAIGPYYWHTAWQSRRGR
jgi:hypothetical protein